MEMLYFEVYVREIKWLIIVIFSYYESYEKSFGDALRI
jgi:hypothetical protein